MGTETNVSREFSAIPEYRKNIEEIIARSDLSGEQKTVLRAFFERLAARHEQKYDACLERVESELLQNSGSGENPSCPLITALIPNGRDGRPENLRTLFPIAAQSEFSRKGLGLGKEKPFLGVFFQCAYETFVRLTDSDNAQREYPAELRVAGEDRPRKTVCVFRRNGLFLKKEKLLRELAEFYGIDVPLLFSPYARRFAEVVFPTEEVDVRQLKSIRFSPEVEALAAGTTATHTLMWNVSFEERQPFSEDAGAPRELPGVFRRKYTRRFPDCGRNSYLLFQEEDAERVSTFRDGAGLLCAASDDAASLEEGRLVRVIPPDEAELADLTRQRQVTLFQNHYRRENRFRKARLLTAADLRYEVLRFDAPEGLDVRVRVEEERRPRPSREVSYLPPYLSEQRLPLPKGILSAGGPWQTLCFSGAEWYAEDYARYVTDYLSGAFPELRWRARMDGGDGPL